MKFKLKERRFDNIIEIQNMSQNMMRTLTRNDFQNCFPAWKSRWNRCINAKMILRMGCGPIEISVSGKATAEESGEILGSTIYHPQAG
jgi:hypothetical protein